MPVDYSMLPKHLQEGVRLYVEQGILPGSFMRAALANDLADAVSHAHPALSLDDLRRIALWVRLHCPADGHGSRATVTEYASRRAAAVRWEGAVSEAERIRGAQQ